MLRSDVLIIGGGVAGFSLAAALASQAKVTLLEAEPQFGYHASGRSAAAFVPGYGNAVIQALTEASTDVYAGSDWLTQRGMMLLARPGEEEAFAAEARGFGLREIPFDDAQARVPILRREAIARIGVKQEVWDIDTDRLLQSYIRTARDAGAALIPSAPVSEIARNGSGWRVTAGETYQATTLVNAAGAWADAVAAMAGVAPLGIVPHKRSMARVAVPGGHDAVNWPFLDGVNERWYAKPDAGALIISPADETPVVAQDAWAEDMDLAQGIAHFEEMVTEPVTRLLANWAGLRSFAPDRALVLGRDVDVPEFVWCAGQGGYGFQTAPAAARFVADILLGGDPGLSGDIALALSASRFR